MSILYRFRDIAGYLSKVADFDPPHLHSAPSQGVSPVEFRRDLCRQKTRVPGLSCGVVCVILRLAVLVELRLVTDSQTDRQTQAHGCVMFHTFVCLHVACQQIEKKQILNLNNSAKMYRNITDFLFVHGLLIFGTVYLTQRLMPI